LSVLHSLRSSARHPWLAGGALRKWHLACARAPARRRPPGLAHGLGWHFIALHLAHQQALARGLSSRANPQAYAEYVFPRCDEIEAKLRRIIAIGPP